MGEINKPYTFVNGNNADPTKVNSDFDTIYNEFNGNIDDNNIDFTVASLKSAILDAIKDVDGTGSGLDADKLDGKEKADILSDISHTDLNDISTDDHHTKYTDSEAVTAVNNETSLTVDISGNSSTSDDADKINGESWSVVDENSYEMDADETGSIQMNAKTGHSKYILHCYGDNHSVVNGFVEGSIAGFLSFACLQQSSDGLYIRYANRTGSAETLYYKVWELS